MNSKFYVSYEAARLLKERGYDRYCIAYYQNGEFHPYSVDLFKLSINDKNAAPPYMNQYSAPTKAEAIDWLESKGIFILLYMYSIICEDYIMRGCWGYRILRGDELLFNDNSSNTQTRLEAADAAIIKALQLL